jgi:hypothetical protein
MMKDMQNFYSVYVGDYAVLNFLAIYIPGLAILVSALFFVSQVTVNEKDSEIGGVEVWQRRREPGREGPRDGHEPVTKVVDVASLAPPAIGQKRLGPCRGLDGLKGLH